MRRRCCCTPPVGCSCVPLSNLTLTTTNSLFGTRTYTMTFDGVATWTVACVSLAYTFRLSCVGGVMVFSAIQYSGGPCPSGTTTTCTGPGSAPLGLTLAAQSCVPLLLEYTTGPCPSLASSGFTKFTVTL